MFIMSQTSYLLIPTFIRYFGVCVCVCGGGGGGVGAMFLNYGFILVFVYLVHLCLVGYVKTATC